MSHADALAFEAVAGDVLADLGYELLDRSSAGPTRRASLHLASYRARMTAWERAAALVQRSPVWRRRHPPL